MIEVVKVENKAQGNEKANELLRGLVDAQTLLVLSGGSSPDYKTILVTPGNILPGAVAIGDERYGQPFHTDSNELMIRESGLVDYLHMRNIPFEKMLTGEASQIVAENYNLKMKELFPKFSKKVGVMGVGADLHTSGIFPNSAAVSSQDYIVSEIVEGERFPSRLTMTLKALGEFTSFLILVFGEEKRESVVKMMDEKETNTAQYPAVIYRMLSAHAYLITDIKI